MASNVTADMCMSECHEHKLCAAVSRMSHEDPIGSAAMHDRYVLVEVPVPWESPIADSKHFPAGLMDVIKRAMDQGQIFRFLSFVSDQHRSPKDCRRVLYYKRPSPSFARFVKTEYLVPEMELNELVEMIICEPDRLNRFDAYELDSTNVRDLFVCTHGSHDVCCGKFGYPIYKLLEDNYAAQSSGMLRVWRASHFGGHRYAPTIADLPEGRYWAHIEPSDLDTLVHRKGEFSGISRKYRGWGGIGKYEQMLEREIFIREGWDWIEYNKSAVVINEEGKSVQVKIEYSSIDESVSGEYEGTIAVSNSVKIGGCGNETKDVEQYVVQKIMKLR